MKEIPKIVIEEAKRQGVFETAAFLGVHKGSEIYSLGLEGEKNWLPGPPLTPIIVAVKDNKLTVLDDDEGWNLAFTLCET